MRARLDPIFGAKRSSFDLLVFGIWWTATELFLIKGCFTQQDANEYVDGSGEFTSEGKKQATLGRFVSIYTHNNKVVLAWKEKKKADDKKDDGAGAYVSPKRQ